jgi:hypothetical protein
VGQNVQSIQSFSQDQENSRIKCCKKERLSGQTFTQFEIAKCLSKTNKKRRRNEKENEKCSPWLSNNWLFDKLRWKHWVRPKKLPKVCRELWDIYSAYYKCAINISKDSFHVNELQVKARSYEIPLRSFQTLVWVGENLNAALCFGEIKEKLKDEELERLTGHFRFMQSGLYCSRMDLALLFIFQDEIGLQLCPYH